VVLEVVEEGDLMARTTTKQDDRFKQDLIPNSLLEDAIKWIAGNFEPEEIFDTQKLESWAESNEWEKMR
jgi:hypothetical protein